MLTQVAMSSAQSAGLSADPAATNSTANANILESQGQVVAGESTNPQTNATELSGATAGSSNEENRPESKRSLTGRRRAGSTSSKRSQTGATGSVEKPLRPVSAGRASQTSQPRAKKKSKFLSFLNCCSAPDDNNDISMQDAPQAAKQTKSQQSRVQQPAGTSSAQASSANDSKGDASQKPADEKIDGSSPVAASGQNAHLGDNNRGEKTAEQPLGNTPTGSAGGLAPGTSTSRSGSRPGSSQNRSNLKTAAGVGAGAVAAGGVAEAVMKANPNITVQNPTPTATQQPEAESLIADRTPEQQALDTDIEMTDVGPSLPLSTNDVNTATQAEGTGAKDTAPHVDLPPPPPLEERQAQVASTAGLAPSQEVSRQPSPVEAQKWLLPPPRPEFKGKKCLILDLDETLVHASFKVCMIDVRASDLC